MGMYERLIVSCPKCDGLIEVQSKAWTCELRTYALNAVPEAIADDLDEHLITCTVCSSKLILRRVSQRQTVPMEVVRWRDGE